MTTTQMFLIVLFVVSLLVLVIWVKDIGKPLTTGQQKRLCKESVRMHSNLNIKGISFDQSTLRCPTIEYTIPSSFSDEEMKKNISDALFNCYDQFFQGKANLFDQDGIYCVACYIIDFEDKNRDLDGLGEYLFKEKPDGKDITYAAFLQSQGSENAEWLKDKIDNKDPQVIKQAKIEGDQKYVVLFRYVKGKDKVRMVIDGTKNLIGSEGLPVIIVGGAFVAGGAALSSTLIGSVIGIPMAGFGMHLITAGGIAAGTEVYLRTNLDADKLSYISLRPFTTESFEKMECEYIPNTDPK